MKRRKGTLTIIPGINVDIVHARSDSSPAEHVPFVRKRAPSWNEDTYELILNAQHFATRLRRVVIFETEPSTREEAHAQNTLKKSAQIFAACRGAEIVSVSSLFADVASFTLNLAGDWSPENMTAARLETLRRKCLRGGIPFGTVIRPFKPARAASHRMYTRLIELIVEGRLEWADYEQQRAAAVGPMWLRCAI